MSRFTLDAGTIGLSLVAAVAAGAGFPTQHDAEVLGGGDVFALNQRAQIGQNVGTLVWEVKTPGVAPASFTCILEGCNGDPTVAANWAQIDTTTAVGARSAQNSPFMFVRCRLTAIVTPGGGISADIYMG